MVDQENDHVEEDPDVESESDEDLEDEDYDSSLKDDILRPASTRSKIVVNLREEANGAGGRKKNRQLQNIFYDLDPYDKVRMQLIFEDKKLYNAYMNTKDALENNIKYQPRKRTCPCYLNFIMIIVEAILMLLVFYVFFLIIQLALFNLVILGILFVFIKRFYVFLEAIRWKLQFNYRTKDFKVFIESQNNTVYDKFETPIKIEYEREGSWLEFLLKHDDLMFEQMIAERREKIFKEKDTQAIEEMKKILNLYTAQKDEDEKK